MLVNVKPSGSEDDDAVLEVELCVRKMVRRDVDACVVASIVGDCWAKWFVEGKALVEENILVAAEVLVVAKVTVAGVLVVAKVLIVAVARGDVVVEGTSRPSFGGVLCVGGPGIPPFSLTNRSTPTAALLTEITKAVKRMNNFGIEQVVLPDSLASPATLLLKA